MRGGHAAHAGEWLLTQPLFPQGLAPPGPSPLQGSSASGWDRTRALRIMGGHGQDAGKGCPRTIPRNMGRDVG